MCRTLHEDPNITNYNIRILKRINLKITIFFEISNGGIEDQIRYRKPGKQVSKC